uniref:Uncharacterized protein n=1 Tax=Rhizophora mucronata TaxID=61149 RepID=A0A2P2Q7S1_RHIMU
MWTMMHRRGITKKWLTLFPGSQFLAWWAMCGLLASQIWLHIEVLLCLLRLSMQWPYS